MAFRNNIIVYTLVPLTVLMVVYAYIRFMVHADYAVAYEGNCDPVIATCFVGCEDDECADTYYYTIVQKNAADIFAQCGADISDCDDANRCLPANDAGCFITYCEPETDGDACETIGENSL